MLHTAMFSHLCTAVEVKTPQKIQVGSILNLAISRIAYEAYEGYTRRVLETSYLSVLDPALTKQLYASHISWLMIVKI